MENENSGKYLALLFTSIIFIFPFFLIIFFVSPTFLVLLLSPASSLIYIIIDIKNKKRKGNGLHVPSIKYRGVIGFPFIIFGLVFIPLIVSFYIAFAAGLDYYIVIMLMGMCSLFVTSSFFVPLSVYDRYFNKKEIASLFSPPVTIIIPAYNEEKGIARTLDSLVEVDYPNKEVMVIDDGSTDRTFQNALKYNAKFQNNSKYSVFHKRNGGKASAINYGLRLSLNEIIVVIDADSVIDKNAIKSIVKHFYDEDVVAVGGYIKILNTPSRNVITNCTTLEVVTAMNILGRALNLIGSIMIVPGALGAFRKKTILQRGSYDKDTVTEDFDITVKLLKSGGKIKFDLEAITFTEIPNNIRGLYNQRKRWNSGNFQTFIKHSNVLTNPSYGLLHKFGYPLTLLLFLYRAIWSILVPAAIGLGILYGRYLPVALSLLMFIILAFLLSAITITLDERRERLRLISYSPLMVLGYQQILDFVLIKSVLDVLFRKNIKWSRAKRVERP